jgi:hypothetical protein
MKPFLQFSTTLLIAAAACAQSAQVPVDFEQLKDKANKTTNISLNKGTIQLALLVIPNKPETAKLRKAISNLQGIYVRSYTFDHEGDYSPSDLEPLRKTITGNGWDCLVSVHNKRKGEDTDLCLRKDKDQILGLAVINAEPKEVTVVNILGAITPEEFGEIQKWFELPEINIESRPEKPKPSDKPEKSKPKDKPRNHLD